MTDAKSSHGIEMYNPNAYKLEDQYIGFLAHTTRLHQLNVQQRYETGSTSLYDELGTSLSLGNEVKLALPASTTI
jgi:hypothetical protein